MEYKLRSFRHAKLILENNDTYKRQWNSLLRALRSISDQDIIDAHESFTNPPKGLAKALNKVLKEKLSKSWSPESRIFSDATYNNKSWRLDFARGAISIEVAFNHGEAIAWNLLKPVIASELNHVEKELKTDIGVIICATEDLKKQGGFDGATGEFEKFERYLDPLRSMLTVPVMIIGLKAPKSFFIEHENVNGKNQGITQSKKRFLRLY